VPKRYGNANNDLRSRASQTAALLGHGFLRDGPRVYTYEELLRTITHEPELKCT
jgi:hypothetical protein